MKKILKKGFTLIELMIVVAIIGILAAIAIPNFIKFQARSKQSEGKTNLKGIFTAEKSYFAEHDTYGSFGTSGWVPERGNRYYYQVAAAPADIQSRSVPTLLGSQTANGLDGIEVDCYKLGTAGCVAQPAPAGAAVPGYIHESTGGTLPAAYPGVAAGNIGSAVAWATGTIDNDPENDLWEVGVSVTLPVAALATACVEGANAPSGIPVNTYNDVACP